MGSVHSSGSPPPRMINSVFQIKSQCFISKYTPWLLLEKPRWDTVIPLYCQQVRTFQTTAFKCSNRFPFHPVTLLPPKLLEADYGSISGHFTVPVDFMVFGFSPLDGYLEASWQTWTVRSLPCSQLACSRLGQYLFLLHYCQSKHLGNGIIASPKTGAGGWR